MASIQSPRFSFPRAQQPVRFGGNPVAVLTAKQKLARNLAVYGNYIDQRAVVHKYGWPVNRAMALAGLGLTGWHAFQAQPEERKKVLIRDALVLGGTIGGTILASSGVIGLKQLVTKLEPVAKKSEKGIVDAFWRGFKPLAEEGEELVETARKSLKGLGGEVKDLHKDVIPTIEKHLKGLEDDAKLTVEKLKQIYDDVHKIDPKRVSEIFEKTFGEDEKLMDEVGEALKFFGIGAFGVLSGIGGGLVANKINGVHDPEKTPNMVKEGIFQFVANIGMCAVGAGTALALMNPKEWIAKVNPKWENKAAKVTNFFQHAPGNKLYRFGGVLAGLSVGILGGAHIANYVGSHFVNPVLDKLQGKPPKPPEQQGKRHIEGMDMVLHVDDIPTAAAIAGTAILGPWIMPFFPVSGYKAGIGYRNDEAAKKSKADVLPQLPPPVIGYPAPPVAMGYPAVATGYPVTPGFGQSPALSSSGGQGNPFGNRLTPATSGFSQAHYPPR